MSIRLKNLDNQTDGVRRSSHVSLGDITATRTYGVFITPFDCRVNKVEITSLQASIVSASDVNYSMTLNRLPLIATSATPIVMATRGNSGTSTANTNGISAGIPFVMSPTVQADLSAGTPLSLAVTIGGSQVMSGVVAHVFYTPLVHRSTR